jgi:mannose-1-phosphate guanylyltransferase/phosphomannomutase
VKIFRSIINAARAPGINFVSDGIGGFIFPEFQPAFDAMYAATKILEMLAQQNTSLGTFWEKNGQPIHLVHRRVPCPWGKKGQVMRLAQIAQEGQRIELIDGVKIHLHDAWVLVLPDGSEAYCHLWVEAKSDRAAQKYLDEYTQKVQDWQKPWDDDLAKDAGAKPHTDVSIEK